MRLLVLANRPKFCALLRQVIAFLISVRIRRSVILLIQSCVHLVATRLAVVLRLADLERLRGATMASSIHHSIAITREFRSGRLRFACFHKFLVAVLVSSDERSAILVGAPAATGKVRLAPLLHVDLRQISTIAIRRICLFHARGFAHTPAGPRHEPKPHRKNGDQRQQRLFLHDYLLLPERPFLRKSCSLPLPLEHACEQSWSPRPRSLRT